MKKIFFTLIFVFCASRVFAAACSSAATGNWSSASTWSAPCNVTGGPTSSNDVTILTGNVVTVDGTDAAASITINSPSGGNNGITITTADSLTVTNGITYNANAAIHNQTITINGSGAISAASLTINAPTSTGQSNITAAAAATGNVTLSGAFAITGNSTSTGTVTVAMLTATLSAAGITITGGSNAAAIVSASTGTITSTSGISFGGTAANAQLTVTGAGTVNLTGTLGAGGTCSFAATTSLTTTGTSSIAGSYTLGVITISSGTTTNNASTTIAGTTFALNTGNWTQGSGSTLIFSANVTFSGTGTLDASTNANTVSYTRGGTQICDVINYSTLTFSGSGAKTCATTAVTNVTVGGTATWTMTASTAISGTLTISGGTLTTAAFTFSVTGTTTISSGTLALANNTGTKTFTGLVTVSGGLLNGASSQGVFQGGITQSSGTCGLTGTATFNTNNQAIAGTCSFHTVSVASGIILTNNGTLTVVTALSGSGQLSQGTNATLILEGTFGISTLSFTASGNTVEYEGASQTLPTTGTTYVNLTLACTTACTLPAANLTLDGNLVINANSPVVKSASNKIIFAIGGGGTQTWTDNNVGTDIGAVEISANSGNSTVSIATDVTATSLVVDSGQTLSGSHSVTITNGGATGDGTINLTGGNFTQVGTGSFGGATVWTFNNLVFGSGSASATTTASGAGSITVNGYMTISSLQTLNAGSKTWNLLGTGGPQALIIQSTDDGGYEDSTDTPQFSSNVAANDLILVFSVASPNSDTITVTDSAGNSYTKIGAGASLSSQQLQVFWAKNTAGGGTKVTVTCHYSDNGFSDDCAILDISGQASTPVDGSSFTTFVGSTTASSGAFTPSHNGALIFSELSDQNGGQANSGNFTSALGFTLDFAGQFYTPTGPFFAYESFLQTTAASINPTFSNVNVAGSDGPIVGLAIDSASGSSGALGVAGTFTASTSTVNFEGTSATSIPALTYNNLGLIPASGSPTYTLGSAASQTFTVNGNLTIGDGTHALTVTAATNNPTINLLGNVTIGASATYTKGTGTTTFEAGSTQTITDNTSGQDLGIVQISSNTTNTTLDLGASAEMTGLTINASQTFVPGSYTLILTGTGAVFTNSGTFTAGTSTLVINDTSATSKTFAGNGGTYGNITFSGDNIIVTGNNTFATMAVNNAGLTNGLLLTAGSTQTVTGFTTNGSAGNLAKLVSTSGGNAATLSKSGGVVAVNYMSIQDSAATGGAGWYAGSHSTNVSGNSGWIWSDAPGAIILGNVF